MAKVTQFCVGIENKPGMLTKLCKALRAKEVNIEALFVSSDEECVWVNLVATPTSAVEEALAEDGYRFFTEEVLTIRAENRPGEIERIATRLADANVNITYVYGSSTQGSHSTLVLCTDDIQKAAQALERQTTQA